MTSPYRIATFPDLPQRLYRPVLLVLALSCLISFPIDKVEASCGDHLQSKSQGLGEQTRINHQLLHQVRWVVGLRTSDPIPCQGPTCRSQEPRPEPVAPVAVSLSTDKYAVAKMGYTTNECRPCFYFESAALGVSDGFPFLVDRPPVLSQ